MGRDVIGTREQRDRGCDGCLPEATAIILVSPNRGLERGRQVASGNGWDRTECQSGDGTPGLAPTLQRQAEQRSGLNKPTTTSMSSPK